MSFEWFLEGRGCGITENRMEKEMARRVLIQEGGWGKLLQEWEKTESVGFTSNGALYHWVCRP